MSALLAAALAWPPPSAPEQRAQRWPPAVSAAGGRGKLAWPLAPALFSACRAARARGRRCGVGGAPRCLCAVCPGEPLARCCCHCFQYRKCLDHFVFCIFRFLEGNFQYLKY